MTTKQEDSSEPGTDASLDAGAASCLGKKGKGGSGALLFVTALALAGGAASYVLFGRAAVTATFAADMRMVVDVAPRVVASLLLAGMFQVLVPRRVVSRWFGSGSGWRGLVLATMAGALTLGGPMASFPLVAAFASAGADIGAVVAYLTGWTLLGINRIFVWELPLLGTEFVGIRVGASLLLPVIAGLSARKIEALIASRHKD